MKSMELNWKPMAAALAGLLAPSVGLGQQHCTGGIRVEGTVMDPNGSAIAGARVQAADGETTTSDGGGRFVLACVPAGAAALTVDAEGFA